MNVRDKIPIQEIRVDPKSMGMPKRMGAIAGACRPSTRKFGISTEIWGAEAQRKLEAQLDSPQRPKGAKTLTSDGDIAAHNARVVLCAVDHNKIHHTLVVASAHLCDKMSHECH
jgi:hypothetical protein